jgi:hypothetical protein
VPPRRALGPILVLAGFGVFIVVGLVTAVILLSQGDRAPEQKGDPPLVSQPQPKPPPPPDPRIKIVQPAVDKGVAFLKARLLSKEVFPIVDNRIPHQAPGIAGLIGLTLLECGVPATDPAVLRVAEIIREAAPRIHHIYVLSSALFFLNRWNEVRPLDENDRRLAQSFALRIIAGQHGIGVWGYGDGLVRPEEETALLARLRKGTHRPIGGDVYSISNTQFAMLALWGARKHGVPVRDSLLAAAAHFNATQMPDGYWLYSNGHADQLRATTTCAGLIALAIERALREDKEFVAKRQAADPAKKQADIRKAFAYLARSVGRKAGDPGGADHSYRGTIFQADAWGDLYFLWSVERVGVIYGENLIGGKDWYDWGYPIVLKAQAPDGSWKDRFGPLVDSCFALLFLKRANIAKDLTDKLRELTRGARAQTAPVPRPPARKDA